MRFLRVRGRLTERWLRSRLNHKADPATRSLLRLHQLREIRLLLDSESAGVAHRGGQPRQRLQRHDRAEQIGEVFRIGGVELPWTRLNP